MSEEHEEREDQEGLQMSFLDHLDELRRRLIHSVLAIAAAFAVCYFFSDRIYEFLAVPVREQLAKARLAEQARIGNPDWTQHKEGDEVLYTLTQDTAVNKIPIPLGTTILVKVAAAPDGKLIPALAQTWRVGKTVLPAGTPLREFLNQGEAAAVMGDNDLLVINTVGGAFTLYLQVALYAAISFAIPFLLYQVWAFISPGLYKHEKRYIAPVLMFASLFFIAGAAFAYKVVFPAACDFLLGLQEGKFRTLITAGDYFDLIIMIMLGLGIVFQIPTIAFLLGRVGLVTPGMMLGAWRYAVIVIAILSAVLTPTPDAFTMLVFAGPMLGLYFFSIGVVWLFGKPRRSDAEVTALAHSK
jgi:sec-independent protein translocase protein TatC